MVKVPNYSDEQLKAFSPATRHDLYKKARALGNPEALALCERLEGIGLPYSDQACIRLDDPIVGKMQEIIESKEGLEAMRGAFEKGLPPLAGVDPLIVASLGVDYGKHNMTTHMAGELVTTQMKRLGFRKIAGRTKALPSGCVARSGVMFEKN